MYKLLHLKWITSKDLLYSTRNSAQCFVTAWVGGEFGREWIHVYIWLSPFTGHLKLSQHCESAILQWKIKSWKKIQIIIQNNNKCHFISELELTSYHICCPLLDPLFLQELFYLVTVSIIPHTLAFSSGSYSWACKLAYHPMSRQRASQVALVVKNLLASAGKSKRLGFNH